MSKRLRVLIADDHQQCLWMLTKLLSLTFDLVGTVADGRQLIDAAMALRPDLIVSDVSMPLVNGNQAMLHLKAKGCDIPFVLISSDWSGAKEYIAEGAMAFVAKIDIGSELRNAMASAYSGHLYVSRSAGADVQADHHIAVLPAGLKPQSVGIL